ncbi:MAG: putative phage abortive infection protein [Phycisphaerales bacterium]|nr:putative phage abortive infection protein [Phycisphaerales bacterium]
MSRQSRHAKSRWKLQRLLVVLLGIAIIGWLANLVFVLCVAPSAEEAASLGDAFGASNALFSALAFVALFYAIRLQSQELDLQRRELRMTRNVLKRQQLELARQAEAMKIQLFENRFFQLLRTHQDIVEGTSLLRHGVFQGRAALKLIVDEMKKTLTARIGPAPNFASSDLREGYEQSIDQAYRVFYKNHGQEVGHYCRHLYHMLRFINDHAGDRAIEYARLIRAQLSEKELLLLFYNGISQYGREKFRPLADRFELFQNLPSGLLVWPVHARLYESAVGSDAIDLQ